MATVAIRPLLVLTALLAPAAAAAQQVNLGHKLPGTLGLQAGAVPPAGLYVQSTFVGYLSDRIVDRRGRAVLRDLDLSVVANQVGVGVSFEIAPIKAFYGMAVGVPFARVRTSAVPPQIDVDRWGLADIYLKPMQIGWRLARVEVLASYAFYIPTGRFEPGPRGGVTSAQWTFEYSLGGTIYFDSRKRWRLSALASYDDYGPKRGIDITRGDVVQVQGGIGGELTRGFAIGLDSYALWQVEDDRGADLPPALRGARDQAVGLGPEAIVRIPSIRTQLVARWEHDIRARSRPLGQIFVVTAAIKAF